MAALISNWDNVETAVLDATNATGSASRENDKYMDHMQSALDRLTAAWQALSVTTLDSGFLTDMINLATDFVETIDTLIDRFGVLGPLITGAFGVSGLMGNGLFKSSDKGIMLGNTSFADIKEAFSTGWNRGKSSDNGIAFFEGFGDAFSEFNQKLSKFDRKALDNVKNILSKGEGNYNPTDLISAFDGTSDALSELRQKASDGRLSLDDLGDSANRTQTSMIKMRAKALALNVGLGILASGLTTIAISVFDQIVNGARNASEAADQAFDDASATATQAAENYTNLTDLISQYQTLSAQDTSDPTVRMQLADVQAQINDLVGEEASSIDLVNGNLNEQLGLLNQIQAKQAENVSEAAKDAYNAAKSVEDTAYGQQSALFGLSHYDAMIFGPDAWDLPDDVKKFIEGKSYYQSDIAGFEIDFSSLDSAVEKAQAAREVMNELEKHEGYASTALYRQMSEAYNYYNKMADDSVAAARTLLESQTQTEMVSSDFASILDANAQQFEQARNSLIESLMNNTDISNAISAGDLNADDVVQYVNTYMSTLENFSSGYNDWVNEIHSLDDVLATSGLYGLEGTGIDMSEAQDIDSYIQKISQLKDAYADFNDGELDTSDIERLKEQFPELNSIMEESGISADNFDYAIATLLDSMQTDMIDSFNSSVGDVSQMSDEAASRFTILSNALNSLSLSSQAMSFTIGISAETDTINNLNDALAASKTATGLTAKQMVNVEKAFQNLEGYDHAKMFEETANGIRLNTQEYEKFSEELTNGKLKEADDALETYQDGLDVLDDKIQKARMSGAENIDELISQREQLRQNINATAQYASQLQGLTSAYKEWQDAESVGSDRDMYESVLSGFESVEDEISRGWLDDASKEFIELLSFDGESFSSIDDYINRWNQLGQAIDGTTYSVRDFFTVNKDGESTNQGVYNFLDAVDQLNDERFKIERDENGIITSFDFGVNGDAAVAEALGVSEELVNIILRASEDAGFVINLDGAYTQLADLQEAAKQAAIDLKAIDKTDMEFTLDTSDSEKFVAEMDEAKRIWESYRNEDGTINWNLDGAKEAATLYSTLVAQADKLSDPVYMQLDTSQVDSSLQEPLEKVQQYDSLLARKHQIEINGGDVSKVNAEMEETVSYLYDLDKETKVKIGIEGMSKEEIEDSLVQGTLEFPAIVDLQVEMSDNTEDIRMALLRLTGAISEEEYQFYIDARLNGEMEVRDDIENVKNEAYDAQEALNNLSDTKYDFNFDTADMADLYGQIDKAKELLDQFRKEDGTVDLSVEGAAQAQQILAALLRQKEELDPPVIMQVEVEDPTSDVGRAMTAVQQLYSAVQERNINIAIGADTTEVDGQISRLVTQLTVLQQNNPELYANLGLNTADFNNALSTLSANIQAGVELDPNALSIVKSSLEGIDVDVLAKIAGLDTSMVDEYVAPDKEATTIYDVNSSKVDRWKAPNKTGTITYNPQVGPLSYNALNKTGTITYVSKTKTLAVDRHNGTAHVDGTTGRAFKQGYWGSGKDGTALVGELGQELVVRDGHFFTIGDKGAEFFQYKKDDIIFNHRQTEELFKNGYVTSNGGRGRAYAQGTAFSSGSGGLGPVGGKPVGNGTVINNTTNNYNYNTSKPASSSSKKSSSSAKKEAEEFKETLDWIEIAIDRVERAIDSLDKTATNTFLDFAERDGALLQQMQQVTNEINLQQQAYERYMAEANSIGLSADWQDKIKNGRIDIEVITDEGLKEQIDQFQEWYFIMPIYLAMNI